MPCALRVCEAMTEFLVSDDVSSYSSCIQCLIIVLQLEGLKTFLSVSAPFGTPLDLSPVNVMARLSATKGSKQLPDQQKVIHS